MPDPERRHWGSGGLLRLTVVTYVNLAVKTLRFLTKPLVATAGECEAVGTLADSAIHPLIAIATANRFLSTVLLPCAALVPSFGSLKLLLTGFRHWSASEFTKAAVSTVLNVALEFRRTLGHFGTAVLMLC